MNEGGDQTARPVDSSESPTISGGSLLSNPVAATAGLMPGSRLGPYQLGERLGAGGMGEVFEALEIDSGRRLALKVLGSALSADSHRQRFFREGRLAASISHPNSVYVFGTDEIAGRPVIAMELVSHGTLRDLVTRDGPMKLTEAIEATLQAAAGLDAAQRVGVLHRDIKPSNLFVDATGKVKVGDFGLSISTTVDPEARQLTQAGSFVGTPSYSSPEQLRGGQMDVRSDIYSLGATLYYLLTGKAPFEAPNPLQLVAAILQDPAPAPSQVRAELPRKIDAIVQRCLAKAPNDRFADYAALRDALVDLLAVSHAPANPGARVIAGVVDSIPLMVVFLSVSWNGWGDRYGITPALIALGYYGLSESVLQASPGKLLLGLRVRRGRSGPGWRAWVRAALYVLIPGLPLYATNLVVGPDRLMSVLSAGPGQLIAYLQYVLLAGLFVTARRRNGYAGLHDLASGTRVISTAREDAERETATIDAPLDPTRRGERIGPYEILDERPAHDDAALCVGLDERLDRRVWIRRGEPDGESIDAARRSLDRPGRLRWLSGRVESELRWDAFEAPDGEPLLRPARERRSWNEVRFWILDLAEELAASQADGSTVASLLDVKRVWITRDGRARLVDVGLPAAGETVTPKRACEFVLAVARAALEGTADGFEGTSPPQVPLPLAAREWFEQLASDDPPDAQAMVNRLRGLIRGPGRLRRSRRLAQMVGLLAVVCLPMAFAISVASLISGLEPVFGRIGEVVAHADALEDVTRNEFSAARTRQRLAIETLIAGRLRDTDRRLSAGIDRPLPEIWEAIWLRQAMQQLSPETVARMRELWSRDPAPTESELRGALAALDPERRQSLESEVSRGIEMPRIIGRVLPLTGVALLACALLLIPLGALLFRGGAGLSLFGIVVVDRRGRRVGRLRALGRAVVSVAVPLASCAALGFAFARTFNSGESVSGGAMLAGGVVVIAVALVVTLWNPGRSAHDRIVGTHLVLR